MKHIPPEIIDGIIALISGAIGWFIRWLKSRRIEDELKIHRKVLIGENQRLVNVANNAKKIAKEISKKIP